MMEMRRYVALITALGLCSSGLHGMDNMQKSMRNLNAFYVGAGIGVAVCVVGCLRSCLLNNTHPNGYSITYNQSNGKNNEIIFDNIKLKKGRDEFTFSGTIWECSRNKDAVGKVIRTELVNRVMPLLREGKSVVVKLNDEKTAHFIGNSGTAEEVTNRIIDVILAVDLGTCIIGAAGSC
jgi:hypothetical protein